MIELIQKYIRPGPAVKLAGALEALLREREVKPGSLLPPVREAAGAVGVSPGTMAAAYKALHQRGLVTADRRRGTWVLPRAGAREYVDTPVARGGRDLQVANPDPKLLPVLRPLFASMDPRSESYGGEHFQPSLRDWALETFRGDGMSADHLAVTSGAIATIHQVLRIALRSGDKVAVEDPGFDDHHACVRAHGMVPVPVELDDEGLRVESLSEALQRGAQALLMTPRLQNPTGAVLSPKRALALRRVLGAYPKLLVLMDDYASQIADAPFRSPLPLGHERWVCVRSFNKTVGPDMRVAVAAGDGETVSSLRRDQWLSGGWVSIYLQRVAASAMGNRTIQKALVYARSAYTLRRTALLDALRLVGISAQGGSGLNVWIPVPSEGEAIRGLLTCGFYARAGARYRLNSPPAIRVTTASLPPAEAAKVAEALAAVLRPAQPSRGP